MKVHLPKLVVFHLVVLCLIDASPAAHIQKNIATIIGSNVEVNIVPETKVDDNQSHVVLDIKSNVETVADLEPNDPKRTLLTSLVDKAIEAVEREEKSTADGPARKSDIWKQYVAQKEAKWRQYKGEQVEEVGDADDEAAVDGRRDRLIRILLLARQLCTHAIEAVVTALSQDYGALVANVMKIIEALVSYFFAGK